MSTINWADESFQIVLNNCYNFSPDFQSRPTTPYNYLAQKYYTDNIPIIKERLMAAGIRLAKILNTIYDKHLSE